MSRPTTALLALCLVVAPSCVSLDYDLAAVPVPISAKPADAPADRTAPLRIEVKNVLWVHGLCGHSQPDVAALVAEAAAGYDRISDFRVRQSASFHDWLLAHLSGTLVRMKSVVIEGRLVRDP